MRLPEPFVYPPAPHIRKHAPAGYKNYQEYKPWLRDEFTFRCVYCLQRETWSRERSAVFSVDHVVPQSQSTDLVCVYANLVYACVRCNSNRQDVEILDPAGVGMAEHLRVETDGTMSGLTADGNDLIDQLHLNADSAIGERRRILRLLLRWTEQPDDAGVKQDFQEAFGYPEDLPNLRTLRPPEGNALEENTEECFHALRETGDLPETH